MGREDQGLAKSQNRYRVIPRTLCFICSGDDVLLLRGGSHKRLWAGKYNGIGGHVEAHEDVYQGLVREVKEETGLDIHKVQLRVVIHIDAGDPQTGIMIFAFSAASAQRETIPSEEGTLEWFPRSGLPVADMVEDLPLLLPRILDTGPADPPFFASYTYDEANILQVRFATVE